MVPVNPARGYNCKQALIEKARSYGWNLRKLNKPVHYGTKVVRYVLSDEHGHSYFARIDAIEREIRRADEEILR